VPQEKIRYGNLDGLRAIAIILVVLFHSNDYIDDSLVYVKAFISTGWNGVYLFFVLSGFLVGSLAFRELDQTGTIQVRRFWMRRFFRTWPLYYILLAFLCWREIATGGAIEPSIWQFLTFTQNFDQVVFFTPTWSLAVEEQFYLVLPLVVALVSRLRSRSMWCVLALAAGLTFPFLFRALRGESALLVAVMDSLVVGVIIACIKHYKVHWLAEIQKYPISLVALGVFVIYMPFFTTGHFNQTFRLGLQGVGFGLILVSALSAKFPFSRVLSSRPFYHIALVSYSIYLSHEEVVVWTATRINELGLDPFAEFVVLVAVVLSSTSAVGIAVYHLIERPGMLLRARLVPAG
jgi:peptidoglycan/LPS O-acetylase OafA/YrhL